MQAKIAMFASILIYLFAIIIFLFFQEQCIKEIEDLSNDGEPIVENHCETLILAIITTFNEGLRNGGGIGDYLIPLSQHHDQVNHGFQDVLFSTSHLRYFLLRNYVQFSVEFLKEKSHWLSKFDESLMTLDESYHPSRFSSDSSQKGKIHLHREFPFKEKFDIPLRLRETDSFTRENIKKK